MDELLTAAWLPALAARSVIAAGLAWIGFRCAHWLGNPWRARVMGLCVTAVVALPLIPLPHRETLPGAPTAILEAAGSITWLPWIGVTWLAGVAWLGARWLIGALWIRRVCLRANDAIIPAEVREQIGKLPRRHNILVSDEVGVPFACGLWRQRVVLPRVSSCWPDNRLVQVLAHELHHHRAGDVLLQTISHAICAMLWWNPLVWLLMREWQREREYAADRAVLEIANPKSYAENLLELSVNLRDSGRSLAAALYMTRRGVLETRIRRLLSKTEEPDDARRWLAALVISAVFIAMPICVAWAPIELTERPSTALENEARVRLSADPFPGN